MDKLKTFGEWRRQPDYVCWLPKDWDSWLVCPVITNRDADTLTRSNWEAMIEAFRGAETEGADDWRTVEESHWACGWIRLAVVRPGSTCAELAQGFADRLEDYPLLNEEHCSELEWAEYLEAWEDWGWKEFAKLLRDAFALPDRITMRLFDASLEFLREFYQELRPNGEFYIQEGSGVTLLVRDAVQHCTRSQMARFLRKLRSAVPT